MNRKMRAFWCASTLLAASLVLANCASSSSSVKPSYVSEAQYSGHSCEMIASDLERVSRQATQIASEQDGAHAADAVLMTVGLIVFWPALIGMAFTEDQEAELARLRGEKEALERAAARKGCTDIVPETPALEVLMPASDDLPETQEEAVSIEVSDQSQQALY